MPDSSNPNHYLFVKTDLAWPRTSGHDVHTYHLMRALAARGKKVSLVTQVAPSPQAIEGLTLESCRTWTEPISSPAGAPLSGLQERFRSYWGIEEEAIHAIARQAEQCQADVVVAVGLEALPLLAAVKNSVRVWYAADEWVWHHLSVFRWTDPSTWGHVKSAMITGLYEYSFRRVVDRAWVVSEADRVSMRLFAGIKEVDVIPNGVDTDHYKPLSQQPLDKSCTFWGRLDFEPNIQALQWFCKNVWPAVRERHADARFRIFGCQPVEEIQRLASVPGISLEANLPDLRPEIDRSQIVVLPFQSGGGVKNKLLEAASMAKPIVCSARACNGLVLPEESPLVVADRAADWVHALSRLWSDEPARASLGRAARSWVTQMHSWEHAADSAAAGIEQRSDRWQAEHPVNRASSHRKTQVRAGFPAWLSAAPSHG